MEFTDAGISQWAYGGSRQVITTWSQSRLAEQGMMLELRQLSINLCTRLPQEQPLIHIHVHKCRDFSSKKDIRELVDSLCRDGEDARIT